MILASARNAKQSIGEGNKPTPLPSHACKSVNSFPQIRAPTGNVKPVGASKVNASQPITAVIESISQIRTAYLAMYCQAVGASLPKKHIRVFRFHAVPGSPIIYRKTTHYMWETASSLGL